MDATVPPPVPGGDPRPQLRRGWRRRGGVSPWPDVAGVAPAWCHAAVSTRNPACRLVRRPAPSVGVELDAAQRSVVAHTAGPLLVVGGPGTGKTTTLVEAV